MPYLYFRDATPTIKFLDEKCGLAQNTDGVGRNPCEINET
jgi:hypothetical protein